jgi:glycosyltransferase involved in cell wall biosynthesis
MKILVIHNKYQIVGGEDTVLKNEVELLINNGNEVILHTVNNESIVSFLDKFITLLSVPFSFSSYNVMKKLLLTIMPDVVHVHNYFPLLSPSIFYACNKLKIPVVHTLHNYRAVCPTALLMHNGQLNETSIKNSSWWSVSKRVYRGSFIGSFSLACMVELHKKMGTWQTKVNRFIALTEFSRSKYIEAGWPENKLMVKPNFIEDPNCGLIKTVKNKRFALFVGRLSEEKGLDILFNAWNKVDFPLKVIGNGPLKYMLKKNKLSTIEYLGRKEKKDVFNLIKSADFIIMPSIWNETFGMVIIEAFACGTPLVGSRLGGFSELVEDGVTGLHCKPSDSEDLAVKINWMIDNPSAIKQMGANARAEYLAKYTPEKNYEMLINTYQQAIDEVNKKNEK